MNPVKQLVMVRHGSHLYGTSTPESDMDFKGVHLPSGQAILLGRAEDVIDRSTVSKVGDTAKNDKNAIDSQSYSLQKFFTMLMKGDTVATEILFAPQPMIVEADPTWAVIQRAGKMLVNRQCKGFVGYCQRQAAKYGIKGSRMAAVKKLRDDLELARLGRTAAATLGTIEQHLRRLTDGEEHMSWENIPNPTGTAQWHIVCCDRKMPMSASINEAFKVYDKVWENYGERSRAAMTNEGIDWKAMSHAVRVAGQAQELLLTGHIRFPRPDAEDLLQIKQGSWSYAAVSQELEEQVAKVHHAATVSELPEVSDQAHADHIVSAFYYRQLRFD